MSVSLRVLSMLPLVVILIGCGSSGKMVPGKNLELVQRDQEIARLQSELDAARGKATQTDKLSADLRKALADLEAEKKLRVEGNRIIMPNAVLFASGSVTITDEGKSILNDVWKALAKYPDREILIEGHTDNVAIAKKYQGKYQSNWELSSARALAVLHYVRQKPDAKPSRLAAIGYGQYRPIADNATENGRKQNRRVVIVVGDVAK